MARNIEALSNLVREKIRKESKSEAAVTSFTDGQIVGSINTILAQINTRFPLIKHTPFRRALTADPDYIVDNETLLGITPPTACTIAHQPDVPRNITIQITDANGSISAFQIDVTGTDENDEAVTEQFLFSGGLSQVGTELFKGNVAVTVTSIAGNGAGDVLDVGIGSSLMGNTRSFNLTAVVIEGVSTNILPQVLEIENVEFEAWQDPPEIHDVFWTQGDPIVTIDCDGTPEYNELMILNWRTIHTLNSETSTLPEWIEQALIMGAAGDCLANLSQSLHNAVNLGGGRASSAIDYDSQKFMGQFEGMLHQHRKPRVKYMHPR